MDRGQIAALQRMDDGGTSSLHQGTSGLLIKHTTRGAGIDEDAVEWQARTVCSHVRDLLQDGRRRLETALSLQTDGEIRRRAPETEGHGGSGSQSTGRSELAHQLIGDGDVTPMQSLELLRALSQQLGVILSVLGDESGCLKLIGQPRAENGVLASEPLHPKRVEGTGHGRVESREDEIGMPRQSALAVRAGAGRSGFGDLPIRAKARHLERARRSDADQPSQPSG
eukprot:scaffold1027_cov116-Isochrysis_galbana.AAC.5